MIADSIDSVEDSFRIVLFEWMKNAVLGNDNPLLLLNIKMLYIIINNIIPYVLY